jgi:DNA-binding HxlR family transcriptional regulator
MALRPTKSRNQHGENECPLEESLRIIAGAWTPKILWYLKNQPRRFGDLKRDLGAISAKVLTTRLRELEEKGVVTRTVMPTSPPTVEYALTPLGHKFHPVLHAIVEVGYELRKRGNKENAAAAPVHASPVVDPVSVPPGQPLTS